MAGYDGAHRKTVIGRKLAAGWDRVVAVNGNLRTLAEPYTADLEHMMIGAARALADSFLQILLSLIVATMFWTSGETLVTILHDALRQLGGPIAEHALDVAREGMRQKNRAIVVEGIESLQPSVAGLRQRLLIVRDQTVAGFQHRSLDHRGLRQHQGQCLLFVQAILVGIRQFAEGRARAVQQDFPADLPGPAFQVSSPPR